MKISRHQIASRRLRPTIAALMTAVLLLTTLSKSQCADDAVTANSAGSLSVTSKILKAELTKIRNDLNLVAVGGTVLVDGQVIAEAVVGSRKQGSDIPVTINDQWHHGSITKSMTATMLAHLVTDGKIAWNSPLFEILPVLKETSHPEWQSATLHHLLTHTSGLPANFSARVSLRWPKTRKKTRELRKAAIIDSLRNPPVTQPGETFTYSNVGYTMVGMIAEELTEKPWEDLIEEYVFEPLQLETAGFGPPVAGPDLTQPWGHARRFILRIPQDPALRADNTPIIGPAGIVHMSMADLAQYGWAHLQPEIELTDADDSVSGGESKLRLAKDVICTLHTPTLKNYGYGWIRKKYTEVGGDVIWHNGSNTMWYSQLMLIPSRRAVVVLVSNDGLLEDTAVSFKKLSLRLMSKSEQP